VAEQLCAANLASAVANGREYATAAVCAFLAEYAVLRHLVWPAVGRADVVHGMEKSGIYR